MIHYLDHANFAEFGIDACHFGELSSCEVDDFDVSSCFADSSHSVD